MEEIIKLDNLSLAEAYFARFVVAMLCWACKRVPNTSTKTVVNEHSLQRRVAIHAANVHVDFYIVLLPLSCLTRC